MNIQKCINRKVLRISNIRDLILKQFSAEQSVDMSNQGDSYKVMLALWKALGTSEKLILMNSKCKEDKEEQEDDRINDIKDGGVESFNIGDFITLLSHSRWDICGFPPVIQDKQTLLMRKNSMENGIMNADEINDLNPLYCFEDKKNGYLAIKLFTSFLDRHGEKAALLVRRFAESRRQYCSLVHICLQLTWFVTDVLKLTPLSSSANDTIPFLAKQNSWEILSEENCVEELFYLALFTFDDIWIYFTDQLHKKPSLQIHEICTLSTRSMLVELLDSDFKNIEQMWGLWSELRVRRQIASITTLS